MNLIIDYANQTWYFELVSVGGTQAATLTTGDEIFASSLVISLHSEIPDMTTLYILLKALTKNAFHGFIPINSEYAKQGYYPTLQGYHVRRSNEGESGSYICEIDYKVFMPNDTIDYSIQE